MYIHVIKEASLYSTWRPQETSTRSNAESNRWAGSQALMGTSKPLNLWLRVHCRRQSGKIGGVRVPGCLLWKSLIEMDAQTRPELSKKKKKCEWGRHGRDWKEGNERNWRKERKGEGTSCFKKLFTPEWAQSALAALNSVVHLKSPSADDRQDIKFSQNPRWKTPDNVSNSKKMVEYMCICIFNHMCMYIYTYINLYIYINFSFEGIAIGRFNPASMHI